MNARPTLAILAALSLPAALAAQEGTAVYKATFTSTWSKKTHPINFPPSPHFSPLIGGTHDAATSFWRPGGIATPGIETMAETGNPSVLGAEVQAAINAGGAESVVAGSGLGRSPGSVSVRFAVSSSHPRVTIVSMLAPSPDWFVGTTGLPLLSRGRWIERTVVDAHVWDAGTDSGTTYLSPDKNTVPKEKIAKVTTASGPFKGASTKIGTWTFERVASTDVYGCGVNPEGSMTVASGVPLLGQSVTLHLHDPLNSVASGASTHLFLSAKADAAFPCGTKIPGFGLGAPGADGELLIDTTTVARVDGARWRGAPVSLRLPVPNQPSLAGLAVYGQGLLVGASRLGLTDAVAIRIEK